MKPATLFLVVLGVAASICAANCVQGDSDCLEMARHRTDYNEAKIYVLETKIIKGEDGCRQTCDQKHGQGGFDHAREPNKCCCTATKDEPQRVFRFMGLTGHA